MIKKAQHEEFLAKYKNYGLTRRSQSHYNLTDKAIFYIFSRSQDFSLGMLKNLLEFYPNNLIFESFLYPLFNCETLLKINGTWIILTIYKYLSDCYRKVEKYNYDLREAKVFGDYLFDWNNLEINSNKKINDSAFLQLRKFLIHDINLNWIENAVIKKTDENTLVISKENKQVLIILNKEKNKANLRYKGTYIHEFIVTSYPSGGESPTPFGVHLQNVTKEENALGWFSSGMESAIFLMVSRLSKPIIESDIKILSADAKFLKILAHVKNVLDERSSEIINYKSK